ncbi:MAG: tetratricopeptide repeat protein [Leptolyngbya sp. Prado105]|nr:tetratricopeptide repeat protein [Leptolyngbya sp. Prado105]
MAIQKFEPLLRAIEIMSPRYGTGYRIGGRLALTVAHLLEEVGSICRVRSKHSFGIVGAEVVWKSQLADIALIELPEEIEPCEAVVLGQLPQTRVGEAISFQMYGYPRWGRTLRETGTAAGGRQIDGLIYLADTSPDGLLVLEPQRLPPEGATSSHSEWEGASGAAIVCNGLVVGVLSQHQNPNRPASLEAVALEQLPDDEAWRELLQQNGISSDLQAVQLDDYVERETLLEEFKRRARGAIYITCWRTGSYTLESIKKDEHCKTLLADHRTTVNQKANRSSEVVTLEKVDDIQQDIVEEIETNISRLEKMAFDFKHNDPKKDEINSWIKERIAALDGNGDKEYCKLYCDFYRDFIYANIGSKMFDQKKYQEAVFYFKQAINKHRKCLLVSAYTGLAHSQSALGRHSEALRILTEAEIFFRGKFWNRDIPERYRIGVFQVIKDCKISIEKDRNQALMLKKYKKTRSPVFSVLRIFHKP